MPDDGGLSALASALQALPIRTAVLTDAEGVVLLRAAAPTAAADGGGDEVVELQRMAVTYAQTAETVGKLKLGKSATATAFYEKGTVVHVNVAPLVLTLLAEPDANVGLIMDAAPALSEACEPMRLAMQGSDLRATYS